MKLDIVPLSAINEEVLTECRMSNRQLTVSLLSYGACIHSIRMHDTNHSDSSPNITLTLDTINAYQENPLYAGATLGPNAGRISGGRLPLPSGCFQLSQNDGIHQLHGGTSNLSFLNWSLDETAVNDTSCTAVFSAQLSDGIDGFPGNRSFSVKYTLERDNTLTIQYHAGTDRPTYINMSNHTYFNLGTHYRPAYDHHIRINASCYTVLNPDHTPAGIDTCTDTPFDFSSLCSIAEQIKKYPGHPGLEIGYGYNHGFILNHSEDPLHQHSPDLTLAEPISGRQVEVFTDAPCIVVYSGGFIGSGYLLEGSIPSADNCAIAIECQDIPDTPNFCPAQMRLTTPRHPFNRKIAFRFK